MLRPCHPCDEAVVLTAAGCRQQESRAAREADRPEACGGGRRRGRGGRQEDICGGPRAQSD